MANMFIVRLQPGAAYTALSAACNSYCQHYLHTDLSVAPFCVRSFSEDCVCNAWYLLCEGTKYTTVALTLGTWFLHYFSSDASRSSIKFPYVCSEPYTNARIHDSLHHAVYRLQVSAVTLNDATIHRTFDYGNHTDFYTSLDALRAKYGTDYVDSTLKSVHRSTFAGAERDSLWSLFNSLM